MSDAFIGSRAQRLWMVDSRSTIDNSERESPMDVGLFLFHCSHDALDRPAERHLRVARIPARLRDGPVRPEIPARLSAGSVRREIPARLSAGSVRREIPARFLGGIFGRDFRAGSRAQRLWMVDSRSTIDNSERESPMDVGLFLFHCSHDALDRPAERYLRVARIPARLSAGSVRREIPARLSAGSVRREIPARFLGGMFGRDVWAGFSGGIPGTTIVDGRFTIHNRQQRKRKPDGRRAFSFSLFP